MATAKDTFKTATSFKMEDGAAPVPVFYTNSANLTVSIHDFRFAFGVVDSIDDAGAVSITPQATLFMSPTHAKALSLLLAGKVKDYEEQIGPILSMTEVAEKHKAKG